MLSFNEKSVFYISTRSLSWSLGDTAMSRQSGSVWRACCCPRGCSPCPPCGCSSRCSWISHSALLSTWPCVPAAERSSKFLRGCTGAAAPLAAATNGTDSPMQWACPFGGRKGKVLELIPPILKHQNSSDAKNPKQNLHWRVNIGVFSPLPQLLQNTVKYWLHASKFSWWFTLKLVSFHQNKELSPWKCFQHGTHKWALAFTFKVLSFIQTINSEAHEYPVIKTFKDSQVNRMSLTVTFSSVLLLQFIWHKLFQSVDPTKQTRLRKLLLWIT